MFPIILLIFISCSDEETTQPLKIQPAPLFKTQWELKAIEYSYSDSLIDPIGWKGYILNSGVVTTIGEVSLTLSDSIFTLWVNLDNFYSLFWQTTDLFGICSGSLFVVSNLLIFSSESSIGIFEFGKNGQEAYASYNIIGDSLFLSVAMPTYIKTSSPPYYVVVGDEFYKCSFVKKNN